MNRFGGISAARQLLEFYKQLFDGQVICVDGKSADIDFGNGTCAGVGIWASDADNYCTMLTSRGASPVLANPLRTNDHDALYGWYVKPATMYAISSRSSHPKEAASLLNFLVNDSDMVLLQGTEKGIPVNTQARKILQNSGTLNVYDAEAGNYVFSSLDRFETMVPSIENTDVITAFRDYADKYAYSVADLDTCAAELADQWVAVLNN